MTTTLSTPSVPTVPTEAVAAPADQRLGFRRAVQVAIPAVTGALLVAAVLTDPGAANEGRDMIRVYADNVNQLQWHATLLHLAYGALGLIPLALAPLVRGRGRRIMNVAAVLGFLVMVNMPGLMMSDLFLAAVSNEHGLDAAVRLYDEMPAEHWAIKAYLLPGLAGMLLTLPVTFAALARARRTSWWAVVPAFLVLPSFVVGAAGPLVLVTAALLTVLSVLVFRATRD